MFKQMLIMPHVLFGLLGVLAAVWVVVEALNATEANRFRLKMNITLENPPIKLEDYQDFSQLARNNENFRHGLLKFDLISKKSYWAQEVNQEVNITNN